MQKARPLFFILTYLLHSLAMCLPVCFPRTECQVIASLLPPKTSRAHHEDCRTSRQASMLVASICQVALAEVQIAMVQMRGCCKVFAGFGGRPFGYLDFGPSSPRVMEDFMDSLRGTLPEVLSMILLLRLLLPITVKTRLRAHWVS